jgi:16S rRNA (cytosine967-C5)-methyltransferase
MRLPAPIALPDKKNMAKYLSVAYSVGEPLAARLVLELGDDGAEKYIASTLNSPATTLRVNTLKCSRDELAENISGAIPTKLSPAGLYAGGSVRDMHGFSKGLFFVQDEASQICVGALGAKAGERVLDVCSCPGSKTFGIAIEMENRGEIFAFDLHKNKLTLVESGAKRLGIDIIKTEAHDAREPIEELFESADRVLCDVPCSGVGVIGKKPEIRYKSLDDFARLPEIQYAILENCSKYVKVGGYLVYSTCTVLPEENILNVEKFLKAHGEFEVCDFKVGDVESENGALSLSPDIHGTDGFFVAKFKKIK